MRRKLVPLSLIFLICGVLAQNSSRPMLHAGENFKIARVKIHARAHRSQHGLTLTRSTVHGEAHPDQVFYHLLDLLIGRRFLHCNDHKKLSALSCQLSAKPL